MAEKPTPDWSEGPGQRQYLHRELVAAIYLVKGEYVASANEMWIAGTWPTLADAAAAALARKPETRAEARRRRDEEDAL